MLTRLFDMVQLWAAGRNIVIRFIKIVNPKIILMISFSIICAFAPITISKDMEPLKNKVFSETESLMPILNNIATRLWEYSEIALEETRSARLLINQLREAGFFIEEGVAQMPTAFIATYGSGSPVIGVLAEYDALPGIGNEPVPERKLRSDEVKSGHGCGHNLFAAASVTGAIAIKNIMKKENLSGTIKLYGTPAEETVVGKVMMAKAGLFDGLDACIDWHPSNKNKVKNHTGRAMNNFEVEFFGQSAHSAGDPWNGRSALDAVELMNYGVNLMREHVKPTTRIHYVIPNGGDAPNVVPEYAKVWYYLRDINREEVQGYYNRIIKIVKGSALATETTYRVHLITGVHEYLLNRPLQEAIQKNLEMVGPPDFTEEDQKFARSLQRNVGKEEKGFKTEIVPLPTGIDVVEGGSTDVAEVSWIVPTAGFQVVTAAQDVPWHSWATTACHGTEASRKGALVAAKVIAATGIDLLSNPELVNNAKAYFDKASDGKPYVSPLDEKQSSMRK
jgi:aminobenzoyl-glutamate utilization protein B